MHEVMHGHQLHRGDAQAGEVIDRGRMGQAGVRPAQRLRDARVPQGEALDVGLVDDRLRLGHVRAGVVAPVEIVGHDDRARHVGGAVALLHAQRVPTARGRGWSRSSAARRRWRGHRDRAAACAGCSAVPTPGPRARGRGSHSAGPGPRPAGSRARCSRSSAAARRGSPGRRRRRGRARRARRRARRPRSWCRLHRRSRRADRPRRSSAWSAGWLGGSGSACGRDGSVLGNGRPGSQRRARSGERCDGGRHWTRTSDLLHVKQVL